MEYQLQGINQVQVHADVGLTFAAGLRSILRQDPDIVMVGEIRDTETASIAVQAALTGHLVLSTLHTNDAAGAIIAADPHGRRAVPAGLLSVHHDPGPAPVPAAVPGLQAGAATSPTKS